MVSVFHERTQIKEVKISDYKEINNFSKIVPFLGEGGNFKNVLRSQARSASSGINSFLFNS